MPALPVTATGVRRCGRRGRALALDEGIPDTCT